MSVRLQPRSEQFAVIEGKEEQEEMWQVYDTCFADTRASCAQDQVCYSREKFVEALGDPDYLKFVTRDSDNGRILALALVTNNLDKARIAYISPHYLRHRFPNYAQQKRLFYVTAIAVSLEHQKKIIVFAEIIDVIQKFIWEKKAMVTFDFSLNKNPKLAEAIASVGKKQGREVATEIMDHQCYVAQHFASQDVPS